MSRYVRELVFLVCSHRFVALVFGVEVGAVVAAEEAPMNIPPWPGDLCAYFPAVFNSASQLSDETTPEVDNCLRIIAGKEERHCVIDECLLPDACPGWWAGGLMTGAVKLMAYAVGVEAQKCSLCFVGMCWIGRGVRLSIGRQD